MNPKDPASYSFKIDFAKGSPDPARIYDGAASYIRAFQGIDQSLVYPFDLPGARTILLLEDIQVGSLWTFLRTILESVDDEAIKDLDWKKAVGAYLVRAKHRMLEYIDKRERITEPSEVIEIQAEILSEAKNTEVAYLPHYERPPIGMILANLASISKASTNLLVEDQVIFLSEVGQQRINTSFRIDQGEVEDLITAEEKITDTEAILMVKKPDYLGQSMWDVRERDHTIRAKVADEQFLEAFQNRKVDVRPGDALRADLRTSLRLTKEGEVVGTRYTILRVIDIFPSDMRIQDALDI